jgi:hypothetical protein
MPEGRSIFSQLIDYFPYRAFQSGVEKYHGDRRIRSFRCWEQLLVLAFAQLTSQESLRDIETGLRSLHSRLYHMGFRGTIARSTLADANENRDWRIYQEFAWHLIAHARQLYCDEPNIVELAETVYAFDSTMIDLCLSLFPWAQYQPTAAAVKMHTLLDLRGSIPSFILITDGTMHDVRGLDYLPIEPGAYYVMDRGYLDFARLYRFTTGGAFFVVRAKKTLRFVRCQSREIDTATDLRADQTIRLCYAESARKYPAPLRRVTFRNPNNGKRVVLLTNQFILSAKTIVELYRSRWQIETFFRWIKQNMRIKAFYGTSENAVKTQIWTAIAVYTVIAIVKKELNLTQSMHELTTIIKLNIAEKLPLVRLCSDISKVLSNDDQNKQLCLLNF